MRRHERGMVTAELATIVPFGVAFAVLLLWVVSLGHTQVRLADASREAARLVARGESIPVAEQMALQHAPDDAEVSVDESGGLVTVTVTARSTLGLPVFDHIGSREMSSTSVAASEDP